MTKEVDDKISRSTRIFGVSGRKPKQIVSTLGGPLASSGITPKPHLHSDGPDTRTKRGTEYIIQSN